MERDSAFIVGEGRRRKTRRPCAVVAEALEGRHLLSTSAWAAPGSDGRLVYGTTAAGDRLPDFSRVGYKTGNVPLPNTPGGVTVPVKRTVNPGAGDMTATIQAAIDAVEAMTPDANGFRGAVLLTAGNYPIGGTLTINASGVVLMGQGDSATAGTRLEATGTAQRFLISVAGGGSRSTVSDTTHNITDAYVPVGADTFHVDSTANWHVGDAVVVNRPSTANWIHDIGMDLLDNPWTPGSKDQNWERVITGISGNTVTIDVPLTNSLDQQYGGGKAYRYTWAGRISQVGLSDLYAYSDEASRDDLNHATGSITMDRVVDGWIHNVTSDKFAVNQVVIGTGSKYVTVDDVVIQNTSTGTQAPPAGLSVNGQLILAENLTMHGVYHAVALTSQVPGPNVIYDLTADGAGSDCGPHQRWSTGGLFDNVHISGNDLQAYNRGNSGTGHGWAGANYVFWNSTARNMEVADPPTAQNWVIGGSGNVAGDGTFDQFGTTVTPQSLYVKQLWERLHAGPTVQTSAAATPNPRTGATAALSVLGASDAGESGLTYTWAVTSKPPGAADPTFGANGTNAAKNCVATFPQPGTYVLTVTIMDAGGLLATSSVTVADHPATPIDGDRDAPDQDDTIRIVRNGAFVDAYRNDAVTPVLHQDYATSPGLTVGAGGGNDTILVDYSGGNPIPAGGLFVDAGAGAADVVRVIGSAGNDAVTLATGSVGVSGAGFGYAGAEELDLTLGAAQDTLAAGGNASVSAGLLLLTVTGGGTLSMAGTLPDFTDLTVGDATFNLNGVGQAIDSLSGTGTVTNNSATSATLTVGRHNGGGTFAGSLTNGAGTLSLTKVGSGTLTLAGANSYTGATLLAAGVIESGNAASFAGLAGPVWFDGGTFHVTADTVAAGVSNKFATSFSGATTKTGTFDIDAGVTLTIGTGSTASLRTNGGGARGGAFIKTGAGTLRILGANGQQDDPLQLKQGTLVAEHADALGRGDAGVRVDMSNGTTLVLRQDASSNFQTPIYSADVNGTIHVVIDRLTPGPGVTHSVNALTSAGGFTLETSAGPNVTGGVAGLTLGSATMGGNGTFGVDANSAVTVTGPLAGGSALIKVGPGTLTLAGPATYTGVTVVSAGTLLLQADLTTPSAVIVTGGVLRLAPGGSRLLRTPSLSITGVGQLDLADNSLIVDYTGATPITTIRGYLFTGRAAGAWAGPGLVSSTAATTPNRAIASAEAFALGLTTFAGQPVDSTALLLKYAPTGDANFDGKVNADDYALADRGKAKGLNTWVFGDFDYSGAVTAADYALLDHSFAPPPEPETVTVDAPAPVAETADSPEFVGPISSSPPPPARILDKPLGLPTKAKAQAKPKARHKKPAPKPIRHPAPAHKHPFSTKSIRSQGHGRG